MIASFFCVICALFSPGEHYHAEARFFLWNVRSEMCRDSYDALTTAGYGEFFNHFAFKKGTLMIFPVLSFFRYLLQLYQSILIMAYRICFLLTCSVPYAAPVTHHYPTE